MVRTIIGPGGTTTEPAPPFDQGERCCVERECEGEETPPCFETTPCAVPGEARCFETIATSGPYEVRRIHDVEPGPCRGFIVVRTETGERITPLADRMKALALMANLTTRASAAPWRTWRRNARQDGCTRWVR